MGIQVLPIPQESTRAKHIRLGVLITYHNERVMLQECLHSLANQSAQPDEVMIYDDCSQYPAENYLFPGLPVKIIRGRTNDGPSAGRNRLLDACSAEYVHFHDADDLFRSHWGESVRSCMSTGNADVILSDVSLCRDGRVIHEHFYGFGAQDAVDFLRLAIRLTLVPSTGTYRRDAVYKAGRYDGRRLYGEDYDFHLRLALSEVRYMVIQEPLILQRIHGANRSLNKVRYWSAGVEILSRMLSKIPAQYHLDVAEAAAVFGSDLYRFGRRREAQAAFELSMRAGKAWVRGKTHMPAGRESVQN
jgi:glycosyltransferase involved in cell wall biosynthesis